MFLNEQTEGADNLFLRFACFLLCIACIFCITAGVFNGSLSTGVFNACYKIALCSMVLSLLFYLLHFKFKLSVNSEGLRPVLICGLLGVLFISIILVCVFSVFLVKPVSKHIPIDSFSVLDDDVSSFEKQTGRSIASVKDINDSNRYDSVDVIYTMKRLNFAEVPKVFFNPALEFDISYKYIPSTTVLEGEFDCILKVENKMTYLEIDGRKFLVLDSVPSHISNGRYKVKLCYDSSSLNKNGVYESYEILEMI